ncbi:type II secretion system protein [Dielma fastidiosa]|uniref:type II secretion system protein n=1 Tax=Dielma fastidiosa TaxID=1034346 RepID=UPI0035655450
MMNKINKKGGFTLIELIVSIGILMIILGAIGNMFVPVLRNYHTINTDVDYQNTLNNISSSIDEQIRYLNEDEIILSDECIDGYVCIRAADYQDQFYDSSIELELSFSSFYYNYSTSPASGINKVMSIKKAGESVYTLSNSLKMMNYSGNTDTGTYTCLNYKVSEK